MVEHLQLSSRGLTRLSSRSGEGRVITTQDWIRPKTLQELFIPERGTVNSSLGRSLNSNNYLSGSRKKSSNRNSRSGTTRKKILGSVAWGQTSGKRGSAPGFSSPIRSFLILTDMRLKLFAFILTHTSLFLFQE
mgnify:CR=1 FL=1